MSSSGPVSGSGQGQGQTLCPDLGRIGSAPGPWPGPESVSGSVLNVLVNLKNEHFTEFTNIEHIMFMFCIIAVPITNK